MRVGSPRDRLHVFGHPSTAFNLLHIDTLRQIANVRRIQSCPRGAPMSKIALPAAAVASLALVACTTSGSVSSLVGQAPQPGERFTYPETPVLTSGELVDRGSDPDGVMNLKPVAWPMRFKTHTFSAHCYDTLSCHVVYDGVHQRLDGKPSPPSSKYGPGYLNHLSGGHLGIRNFPPPATVNWRSKDGATHSAEIDIGRIFGDELIRHFVPKEELAETPHGRSVIDPLILLEVNDRTIRVYMRAYIPTMHIQKHGKPRSTFRDDLVLAETFVF
jgi:hypothetical protein